MFSIIYSEEFLKHNTGTFHPESPQRLIAIVDALKKAPWSAQLTWLSPTPTKERNTLSYLKAVHLPKYVQQVEAIATQGGGRIDADTIVSPYSYDVSLLAVSAWLDGIDQVITNQQPAFVLARPPGHHAKADRGMGFCLFSNAAIAAHYALQQPKIKKVAILDWDVHHGNGTEAIVQDNPNIIYCSLHQSPAYPGTGKRSDRGFYNNVLNIPLAPGSTLKEYQQAFEVNVLSFIENFKPDLLIVSAGYDANLADPLAEMALLPEDYGVLTKYCLKITRSILFGLEGGYDLETLAKSVLATVRECL